MENMERIFFQEFSIVSILWFLVEKLNFELKGLVLYSDEAEAKVSATTKEPVQIESVKISPTREIPIYLLNTSVYCKNEKLCTKFLKKFLKI